MNKIIHVLAFLVFILSLFSCNKKNSNKSKTEFEIIASDSLVFSNKESKLYHFKITPNTSSIFDATFSTIPNGFVNNSNGILTDSNGQYIIVQFNKQGILPGKYQGVITVTERNNTSNFKSKNVDLIYRPNCAYNYITYKNSILNYVIAGITQNGAITCDYNDESQLVVKGLSLPYDLTLTINCNDNTVVMSTEQIDASTYHTGSGNISNGLIYLTIYSNGTLFANLTVKP